VSNGSIWQLLLGGSDSPLLNFRARRTVREKIIRILVFDTASALKFISELNYHHCWNYEMVEFIYCYTTFFNVTDSYTVIILMMQRLDKWSWIKQIIKLQFKFKFRILTRHDKDNNGTIQGGFSRMQRSNLILTVSNAPDMLRQRNRGQMKAQTLPALGGWYLGAYVNSAGWTTERGVLGGPYSEDPWGLAAFVSRMGSISLLEDEGRLPPSGDSLLCLFSAPNYPEDHNVN
jgi:hypothetical protein